MILIYYAENGNGIGERLLKAINATVPEERTEVYRSLERLSQRLRRPTYNLKGAVLLTTNRAELSGIISLRDMFRNVRIILILPDRDKDTISEGLKLHPRFLTDTDSNFKDVVAVLGKMMGDLRQ
jgi:hypothetical protein